MKRNLSKILTVVFFMVNTTLLSCFGIGDSLIIWLEYEKVTAWDDIVGIYNNNYDRNEYLILHKDTTFAHIYVVEQEDTLYSRGTVNFCLKTEGYSKVYYDNWKYYGNYINEVFEYLRPEEVVNSQTLRCGSIDYSEYDYTKLQRNAEKYLNQFDCKIESAYSLEK